MLLTKLKLATAMVVLMLAAAAGALTYRIQASEPAGALEAMGTTAEGQTGRPLSPEREVEETKVVMAGQKGRKASRAELDARRTAEVFSTAMSENKIKDAARLCWPEQYNEGTLRELKEALGRNRLTVDSVDSRGDVALALSGKMKLKAGIGEDGNPEIEARLLLVLCKKDGDWQIQVIDLGSADQMEQDRALFRTQFPD